MGGQSLIRGATRGLYQQQAVSVSQMPALPAECRPLDPYVHRRLSKQQDQESAEALQKLVDQSQELDMGY